MADVSWQTKRSLKAWETRRARGTVRPAPKPIPAKKRCPGCATEKPIGEFGTDRRAKWGLSRLCRACIAAYWAARRTQHKSRIYAVQKRWRLENRDKWRAMQRRQRARVMATCPERLRAKARRRYAKKAAHINKLNARRRAENPERYRAIQLRCNQKRRAQMVGATVERIDYDGIKRRDGMVCHICRLKVADKELHFDHVIPLAKGGEHTERNIAVSHARCNQKKNSRVLTLF